MDPFHRHRVAKGLRYNAPLRATTTAAPSQDAPTQMAHRTLEKLGCMHKTCLSGFCLTVANKAQRRLGGFCSFVEAS